MKKNPGPYIPMSDCECYLMALELVQQAIEEDEKYIYLNDWLQENACAGYPHDLNYIVNMVEEGKKLLYFAPQDGNLYISNGYTTDYPTRIYFSIYPGCDDVSNSNSGAWLTYEFAFEVDDQFSGNIRSILLNVDPDTSFEEARGLILPANSVGIIRTIHGNAISPSKIYYLNATGYVATVGLTTVGFTSFLQFYSSGSDSDGSQWNFRLNRKTWSDHATYPYIRVTDYTYGSITYKVLMVIDETNAQLCSSIYR